MTTLRLDAGAGNPHGFGARVEVEGRTSWNLPGGIFGQAAAEVYVGLGEATSAEATVTWPDGAVETVTLTRGDEIDVAR